MRLTLCRAAIAGLVALPSVAPLHAQGRGGPPEPPVDQSVPTDLKALLAPHRSEMRLVTVRYTADRALLNTNFAGVAATSGGGGGGGGRPPAPPADTVPLSRARVARLKRFDLSWQTALAQLDAATLTAPARADLDSLKRTVAANLARLDDETRALAKTSPLTPFAQPLVDLVEARIRVDTVSGEDAARTLTTVTRDLATLRARLGAGLGQPAPNGPPVAPLRVSREQATLAAKATETLRANLAYWYTFFDGYDPLFTWWVEMPYKKVDDALKEYATYLSGPVASANGAPDADIPSLTIPPAPPPKYGEVPNLRELLALPQDEMTDVVRRFVGSGGTGRASGGRGNDPGSMQPRDSAYYNGWLAALNALDFDRLTRNAQVDYLYLRNVAEVQLRRIGRPLPPNPPRKADTSGIPGAARGREGLIRDLQDEMIPYTPEQLIALAEREFAWCDAEMRKASRAMGFGDDWKKALEKTKTMHPPPGGQPAMIRDLLQEAVAYLRANDLITVPPIDAESQHMIMMSPERQLVNPFFLGGALIQVSFPTNTMEFDARQQSMRGNSRPWSHATAFHEMIPGHNLVFYYGQRFAGYRAQLGASGPFFGEGWPVYWETIMYDKGFHDTPEEKVGALVWRMHRCARIIFSLKFHMGEWSPQEAVDFLVDRVGFERDNARAEVLRSFQGGYGPLYQAGYLLGALQFRGLRRELVDTRLMPEKQFHDEILRQGSQPVALIRLALGKQKLTRDTPVEWKFYGDLPSK